MRAVARAKVNLYLEVVGRRPDGYHDLRTLFQTVRWGDDVEVEPTADAGVTCRTVGADVPDDDRNLAVRAARAWLAASGAPGGVRVALDKRVPVGGGLGGGSSDAATVLRLLDADAGARALGPARLAEVAAGLGADVPFLLAGGGATGTGRGEVLAPLADAPPVTLVLVLPPFGTETGKVARAAERAARARGRARGRRGRPRVGRPARACATHHNDLAEAAIRAYPELLRFTAQVERALGRPPCPTGSGSTLFDVPDRGEADEVVARLARLPGRREVVVTG